MNFNSYGDNMSERKYTYQKYNLCTECNEQLQFNGFCNKCGAYTSLYDAFEVKIRLNRDALSAIEPLLYRLQNLSLVGASRVVQIEEYDSVFYDGDGAAQIESIDIKQEKGTVNRR
jgi:predicted ATP-dependent serine protease